MTITTAIIIIVWSEVTSASLSKATINTKAGMETTKKEMLPSTCGLQLMPLRHKDIYDKRSVQGNKRCSFVESVMLPLLILSLPDIKAAVTKKQEGLAVNVFLVLSDLPILIRSTKLHQLLARDQE